MDWWKEEWGSCSQKQPWWEPTKGRAGPGRGHWHAVTCEVFVMYYRVLTGLGNTNSLGPKICFVLSYWLSLLNKCLPVTGSLYYTQPDRLIGGGQHFLKPLSKRIPTCMQSWSPFNTELSLITVQDKRPKRQSVWVQSRWQAGWGPILQALRWARTGATPPVAVPPLSPLPCCSSRHWADSPLNMSSRTRQATQRNTKVFTKPWGFPSNTGGPSISKLRRPAILRPCINLIPFKERVPSFDRLTHFCLTIFEHISCPLWVFIHSQ